MKECVDLVYLSKSQHAYIKGRSTETAIHSLVGKIERTLKLGELAMVAFLDIEGAFNNVTVEAIISSLVDLQEDSATCRLIQTDLISQGRSVYDLNS